LIGNPAEPSIFNLSQIEALPVVADVEYATRADPILSQVLCSLRGGWPERVSESLLPYWRRREELTVEGDCILWGCRVVIRAKLHSILLGELHEGEVCKSMHCVPSQQALTCQGSSACMVVASFSLGEHPRRLRRSNEQQDVSFDSGCLFQMA